MDAETRFQIVNAQQQQLRDEASAYRLARGGKHSFSSSNPVLRIPRTIGDLRRLARSMA